MEPYQSQYFKPETVQNKSPRFGKRVLLYFIFVLVSTAFWFLIKLGTDFNAEIRYPITFSNIPGQKIVVNKLPDFINISIQAKGFSVLRYKLNTPTEPIVINMLRFNRQIAKRNVKDFDLLTRNITEDIKNQLPTDIELVSVSPDTIPFLFSNISEKKVPIKSNIKLKFALQFNINGDVKFTPDSVIVSGPDVLLDTLKAVFTTRTEFTNLKNDTRDRIDLQKIDGINLSRTSVLMQIPVSKFTEANLILPVNCINVPDSLKMSTIPDAVSIKFMVSLSNYESVTVSDFRLEIDAKKIQGHLSQQLPVEIVRKPDNIYNIQIIPEQVSYILQQKP